MRAPLRDLEQYNWYHMERYHTKRCNQDLVVVEPRTTLSLIGRTRRSVRVRGFDMISQTRRIHDMNVMLMSMKWNSIRLHGSPHKQTPYNDSV